MRPLLFGLALALTVFAFIPFSLAQEGQRLKPAELGQLQAKAQAGDPVAMRALGDAYRDGNGTPANLDLALSWYERAAAAGNSTALYNMAIFRVRSMC
jgi:TPR repeat protein